MHDRCPKMGIVSENESLITACCLLINQKSHWKILLISAVTGCKSILKHGCRKERNQTRTKKWNNRGTRFREKERAKEKDLKKNQRRLHGNCMRIGRAKEEEEEESEEKRRRFMEFSDPLLTYNKGWRVNSLKDYIVFKGNISL